MTDPRELADEACRIGREAGLDAVGVAPAEPFAETRAILEQRRAEGLAAGMQFTYRNPARATDPGRTVPGAAALVVGARHYAGRYPQPHPREAATAARPAVGGRVARYSWVDHYAPLREALGAVARHLVAQGWRARVLADDNALVDREAARRAGLGWYGKNTNLLLGDQGSWFVLGSVVTDAPLPPAEPVADGCGACSRCLSACPTGALVAPGVLDARRCLAWLVQAPGVFPAEYREALGDRLYGCDDCQEACPINRRAERRQAAAGSQADREAGEPEPLVDVLELLAATDDDLLARWGRWYIAERDPAHLRRNALLVLGNVGSGDDPAVLEALRRALADPRGVVRAHAAWAADRLGHRELLAAVAADPDPRVVAELRRGTPTEAPVREG